MEIPDFAAPLVGIEFIACKSLCGSYAVSDDRNFVGKRYQSNLDVGAGLSHLLDLLFNRRLDTLKPGDVHLSSLLPRVPLVPILPSGQFLKLV